MTMLSHLDEQQSVLRWNRVVRKVANTPKPPQPPTSTLEARTVSKEDSAALGATEINPPGVRA